LALAMADSVQLRDMPEEFTKRHCRNFFPNDKNTLEIWHAVCVRLGS
jgi:hypothetical protein